MSDLNRKQFEEYYNDWGGFGCQYCLHHRMGDSYNIPDIAKAWRHWQASRECLVIKPEWPDRYEFTNPDVAGSAILDCRSAFQKALTAAGVKYK